MDTEFAQFKNEDGIYHYPNLPWHSTIEEVEAITGWNVKDNFYGRTPDDVDFPESLYCLQNIPFDGQNCTVELQFDRNDELWAISMFIAVDLGDLRKQYRSLEKKLIRALGKPDRLEHDYVPEGSNVTQSAAAWHVWDENEKLVNTFSLSFSANLNSGREKGYLLVGAKWKDEGFIVIE